MRIEMNDRIERDQADESRRLQAEVAHVAHTKVQSWIQPGRALDHCGRQVDAHNLDTTIVQIPRHVSRTATDVGDEPPAASLLREAVEKMSVEWLVVELRCEVPRVRFRGRVVAVANIHAYTPPHSIMSATRLFSKLDSLR